jgi:hypothetical protein
MSFTCCVTPIPEEEIVFLLFIWVNRSDIVDIKARYLLQKKQKIACQRFIV